MEHAILGFDDALLDRDRAIDEIETTEAQPRALTEPQPEHGGGDALPSSSLSTPARATDVSEEDICFSEGEVAQVLWVLTDAAEHAAEVRALSTLVLMEETLQMVRARFDERRGGDQ